MSTTAKALLWVSVLETVSFVALLGMMLAGSEQGVSIVGAVHGVLFLAYAATVWYGRETLGWTMRFVALVILTGPIGAIIAVERLRRDFTRKLEGGREKREPSTMGTSG